MPTFLHVLLVAFAGPAAVLWLWFITEQVALDVDKLCQFKLP